ncbi:MAG: DUF4331 domain-containing protein [Planctomycetota bacterium]
MIPIVLATLATVSSHREAPFVAGNPRIDATDFYMFRSYEPGREDHVILVANYLPLQDPYGGPNFFNLDRDALYEILIDNDGDAREDITFQFRFGNALQDLALPIGPPGDQRLVSIPLANLGSFDAGDTSDLNVRERYQARVVYGNRRSGSSQAIANASTGAVVFRKPADNIGLKSIPDYEAYASAHMYPITLPGGSTGRMFVGQRKDPFVVNLGEIFDLVNTNPLGPVNAEADDLADKNVTSIVLEVPIDFLVGAGGPVIGGWTAASLRKNRELSTQPSSPSDVTQEVGPWVQVSRLGMPLVNEVVIGLKDKDRFNASEPSGDGQFLEYVTHPTLPAILQALFPVTAPTAIPRTDLVAVFLTGISGLNETATPSEMLRLNTMTRPTPAGMQNNLGVIGGDTAGFPNGRRPGDDVVDVALRVVMGVLLPLADAPSGQLPFTDGAYVDDSFFDASFPFLKTPLPGSPN